MYKSWETTTGRVWDTASVSMFQIRCPFNISEIAKSVSQKEGLDFYLFFPHNCIVDNVLNQIGTKLEHQNIL